MYDRSMVERFGLRSLSHSGLGQDSFHTGRNQAQNGAGIVRKKRVRAPDGQGQNTFPEAHRHAPQVGDSP